MKLKNNYLKMFAAGWNSPEKPQIAGCRLKNGFNSPIHPWLLRLVCSDAFWPVWKHAQRRIMVMRHCRKTHNGYASLLKDAQRICVTICVFTKRNIFCVSTLTTHHQYASFVKDASALCVSLRVTHNAYASLPVWEQFYSSSLRWNAITSPEQKKNSP